MRIRVLGCSGAEFPNSNLPAFLIDETILLDAGTIGAVLNEEDQWKIRHILLTHAHLDHIIGIPFLLDNIVIRNKDHNVKVISIPEVLKTLKDNLFNDRVWPDFTKIPSPENPVLRLEEVRYGKPFKVDGYRIEPLKVNHPVPAVGYIIEKGGKRFLYTGDTGPTDAIWREVNKGYLNAIIIEVSFPNRMKELAINTGHLTPRMLADELRKIDILPQRIFITHPKPQYYRKIKDEIEKLKINGIVILSDKMVIGI
jgi:ribonuclease BN (tRNA processing enzyme)